MLHFEEPPAEKTFSFWRKFKSIGKNVLSGLKIAGLALIGMPLAVLWGAALLLLKTAWHMAEAVLKKGLYDGLKALCSVVYNVLALGVNSIKAMAGNKISEYDIKDDKRKIQRATSGVLNSLVRMLFLGIFYFKEIKNNAHEGRKSYIHLDTDFPLVQEAKEIGEQINHKIEERSKKYIATGFFDVELDSKPEPKYDGNFKQVEKMFSRIEDESKKLGLVRPESRRNSDDYGNDEIRLVL